MSIALDTHYMIGKLHLYCEDYAWQGERPFPHSILADGCSASMDSDLGARLLVLSARRLLPRFARAAVSEEATKMHWPLGRHIVRFASRRARELGLDTEVLDATLLVAWCDGETVYVHLYGDGCIVTRRPNGDIAVIQVEYTDNAPYYLSYLLDNERYLLYQEAVGNPLQAQTTHYWSETGVSAQSSRFDAPLVFKFALNEFSTVAVATDGLGSFINVDTRRQPNLIEVARAMLAVSADKEGFVKNQMRKALREFATRQIVNLDDLSLGVFAKMD